MTMTHKEALHAACDVHDASQDMCGLDGMEAAIRAYLEARGLVMVPREPTEEMLSAVWSIRQSNGLRVASVCYDAMLAAAPDPFADADPTHPST